MAATKARFLPFPWRRSTERWADGQLGGRAGRAAVSHHAAMLSYSYYAHAAFSRVPDSLPKILFQVHPHPSSVRDGALGSAKMQRMKVSCFATWVTAVPILSDATSVPPGAAVRAVKFPPHHAPAVVKNAKAMLDDEARRLEIIRKAKTAAEVRAANSGGAYTAKKG